ncbi:hypothetical protein V1520DRAFT_393174 [Lipomyces starkeyi]
MNTTSRDEGSHAALKHSLSSSSGTLYAVGQRISYRDAERSTQHSIVGATENLFVRVDIRNQFETSMLCTRISRSALELEEDGTTDKCSCTVRSRYLLPCSHQIQLVQVSLPVLEVTNQNLGTSVLSQLKDLVVLLKRKGRPRAATAYSESEDRKPGHEVRCGVGIPRRKWGIPDNADGDGEEDVEHIVGGSSLTEVWDDVLASL